MSFLLFSRLNIFFPPFPIHPGLLLLDIVDFINVQIEQKTVKCGLISLGSNTSISFFDLDLILPLMQTKVVLLLFFLWGFFGDQVTLLAYIELWPTKTILSYFKNLYS